MQFVNDDNEIFTAIVSNLVKLGYEEEFEKWIKKISQAARNFEGYLGTNVIRPPSSHIPEYVVVLKFNGYSNLKNWMNSEIRQDLLTQLQPLLAEQNHIEILPGLESWFSLPKKIIKSPPKYKMAIIIWLSVFIISKSIRLIANPLFLAIPEIIGQFINVGITVFIITYFAAPFLTKLLAKWLAS